MPLRKHSFLLTAHPPRERFFSFKKGIIVPLFFDETNDASLENDDDIIDIYADIIIVVVVVIVVFYFDVSQKALSSLGV